MSVKKRLAKRNKRHLRQERLKKGLSIGKGSAVALALGLGVAVGGPAEAGIVYQAVNQTITGTSLGILNYLGINQSYVYHYNGPNAKVGGFYGYVYSTNIVTNPYPFTFVSKLAMGDTISAGGLPAPNVWTNNDAGITMQGVYNDYPYGPWPGGGRGFVGFSFPDAANPSQSHYAWAQLEMPFDGANLTIYDWAYNDVADAPIKAGQVPLPGSLLLLASGAFGLLGYRRVRRDK